MTGYTKEETYIKKYGPELGKQKFAVLLDKRAKRERQIRANRKIILGPDLEAEVLNGNAIRCEECGYIGVTLQWTHFAHKCNGNTKTVDEYKKKHPNAPLQSNRLRASFAITKESMTSLYGEEEGKVRWESYCAKQAETNTLEYKKVKYNMTEAEFKTYNKSRSVTLPNLVARHGEELGLEKWNAYCEQQRYTTSLEYFVEKYGEVAGTLKYDNFIEGRNLRGKSNVEVLCYDELVKYIPDLIFQYKVVGVSGACDMGNDNLVIEFYGQYWHADPRCYAADWVNSHTKRTAQQVWELDRRKQDAVVSNGFRHYIIWEHDYRKDMDKTIENLLEWANGTEQTGDSRPSCKDRTA